MTFSLTTESRGTTRVLVLSGELDIATAPRLRRALLELLGESRDPVVLDLSGVPFMDSSGLAVIIAGHKRARYAGTSFAVSRLGPAVAKVFELTHADRLVPVLDDPSLTPA